MIAAPASGSGNKNRYVFGLLGILNGTPHYTCLSNEECNPDLYHIYIEMTAELKDIRLYSPSNL